MFREKERMLTLRETSKGACPRKINDHWWQEKRTVADIGSRPTYRRARKSTGRYRGCLPRSWRVHSDASRQARAVARLRARYRVAFRHTSGGVISFPPLAANTLGLKAGRGRSLIPCCAYSTSVCPSLGRKQLFGRPRWARIPLRTCQILSDRAKMGMRPISETPVERRAENGYDSEAPLTWKRWARSWLTTAWTALGD